MPMPPGIPPELRACPSRELAAELAAGLSGSAMKQVTLVAERFESATQSLLERAKTQPELLSWVANDYLDLTGYLLYGFMWDKMEAALDTAKHSEDFTQSKQLKAKFYYSRVLPRIESLFSLIEQFPEELSAAEPKLF